MFDGKSHTSVIKRGRRKQVNETSQTKFLRLILHEFDANIQRIN